jgi:hypothetical protein
MRNDTIESFLQSLAARVPAPGGGATAALHAAQAAALVAMVARYSDGSRYAEHAEEILHVCSTADALREEALTLTRPRSGPPRSRRRCSVQLGHPPPSSRLPGPSWTSPRRFYPSATPTW